MKKVLLSFIAIAGFAMMSQAQTAQVQTAVSPGGGAQSAISFAAEKHDFGTIPQGTPVSYNFSFTNSGKEPLFIKSATGSCGCTVPEYTQEAIAPGAKGTVKVTYNAAALGPINRTVTITTNSATTPVLVLSIGGEVKAAPAVSATPATSSASNKPAVTAKPTKN